eukprot:TRINITY_DN2886_c0_g1_i2.p1 TRINITY_DN2886_c0_g1~~TRINITY_DN2886_c0_g1_i2.p1  ORF type:complete len:134 (-),score=35.58 TRINITY_DN2886_c0_g1_i2:311-712(-)
MFLNEGHKRRDRFAAEDNMNGNTLNVSNIDSASFNNELWTSNAVPKSSEWQLLRMQYMTLHQTVSDLQTSENQMKKELVETQKEINKMCPSTPKKLRRKKSIGGSSRNLLRRSSKLSISSRPSLDSNLKPNQH